MCGECAFSPSPRPAREWGHVARGECRHVVLSLRLRAFDTRTSIVHFTNPRGVWPCGQSCCDYAVSRLLYISLRHDQNKEGLDWKSWQSLFLLRRFRL